MKFLFKSNTKKKGEDSCWHIKTVTATPRSSSMLPSGSLEVMTSPSHHILGQNKKQKHFFSAVPIKKTKQAAEVEVYRRAGADTSVTLYIKSVECFFFLPFSGGEWEEGTINKA